MLCVIILSPQKLTVTSYGMAPQVVLATGCSSGIGLSTAQRLAQDPDQRYLVIATVIAIAEKTELVAAVGDAIDKTIFIKEMDITKDEDITRVVDDVMKTHGGIDFLINVAGVAGIGFPERASRARIDRIFNVNAIGTIRLTLAVLPHMKQKKAGKIISVSSIAGKQGFPYAEFYTASKFALEGFFESLLCTVRSFNIRICMIEPTQVKTGLLQWAVSETDGLSKDNTVHEIDRRQMRCFCDHMAAFPSMSVDDVVDVLMTKCVEVDDPVFRHLVVSTEGMEALGEAVADLTGEKSIASPRKMIGAM
ncbi:retinol dehydrogenase 8-like [Diadema setosum]|uniref:retinol dehydrogenase 8-like n=1 Tax=Diadema setosum TaxID=31175 RepID=UPI003B3BA3D8